MEIIGAAHRQVAVASLTLAFSADPVMRWGWPEPERYLSYWPRIADTLGRGAFDHATAYGLEGCVAVALWLPPGAAPDREAITRLMRESIDEETYDDTMRLFEQMDRFHPDVPHWYLSLIGVDPRAQGRGLGTRLLRPVLDACDSEHLPAYLKATSPRSRDLYGRHGFNVVGVIQAGTSPLLWAMLREPAS
jgi:GNAT superfamily N-acetyltransferase